MTIYVKEEDLLFYYFNDFNNKKHDEKRVIKDVN